MYGDLLVLEWLCVGDVGKGGMLARSRRSFMFATKVYIAIINDISDSACSCFEDLGGGDLD